jgi:hypothetical protein
LAVALLAAASAAPATAADAGDFPVKLRVSTAYPWFGMPVTVTVTSGQAGHLVLLQTRPEQLEGPGRCYVNAKFDDIVARSSREVPAGQPVSFKIEPKGLRFFDGDLFRPIGWDDGTDASQELCWDHPTRYDRLVAYVESTSTGEVATGTAATRFMRVL